MVVELEELADFKYGLGILLLSLPFLFLPSLLEQPLLLAHEIRHVAQL